LYAVGGGEGGRKGGNEVGREMGVLTQDGTSTTMHKIVYTTTHGGGKYDSKEDRYAISDLIRLPKSQNILP